VKIVEYWDHSREKRAKRCVGKDLDDEVNVECVEYKGGVVHGEKGRGNAAQPGAKLEQRSKEKYTIAIKRRGSIGTETPQQLRRREPRDYGSATGILG